MRRGGSCAAATLALVLLGTALAEIPASASPSDPGLGSATSFAVLAASTITDTGPSVLTGDVGLSPGTAVTGFPPATIVGGTEQVANGTAATAEADAQTGYNDAGSRAVSGTVTSDLANQNLVAGVYAGATLTLSGQLTLDGQNDPDATFILRSSSTLVTAAGSSVALINGAQACHVFWQVGSSATLATNSAFIGTLVADSSVTAQTQATVDGRLIALNGAVTLDDNTVSVPTCTSATAGGSGSPSPTPTMPAGTSAGSPASPSITPAASAPVISPSSSALSSPSSSPSQLTSSASPASPVAPTLAPTPTPNSAATLTPTPAPTLAPAPASTAGPFSTLVSANVAALDGSPGGLQPAAAQPAPVQAGGVQTGAVQAGAVQAGAVQRGAVHPVAAPSATASPDGKFAPEAGSQGSRPVSPGGPLAYTGDPISGLLGIGGAATVLGIALFLVGFRPVDAHTGRHRRSS